MQPDTCCSSCSLSCWDPSSSLTSSLVCYLWSSMLLRERSKKDSPAKIWVGWISRDLFLLQHLIMRQQMYPSKSGGSSSIILSPLWDLMELSWSLLCSIWFKWQSCMKDNQNHSPICLISPTIFSQLSSSLRPHWSLWPLEGRTLKTHGTSLISSLWSHPFLTWSCPLLEIAP